ncbi:Ger(x)C family spore germination protein [Bacillus sp. S/N-304-OC-R1]|uniref:Ger(x)C family spore germination protein n=1 Tax=Bacillus sp. S/N-304-OC-R1 TaxID=2758034 RepID=UPI001C8F001F|nr:Ger(x)C family spore germination protein [Bacillus sp. S/N-304-OC-R1]MBY0124184.1 Ger(x)C family spore germination protein [Bacillus sp. S/N-304-OC-R1]
MRVLVLSITILLLLTGCVQKKIIDEVNIIAGEAYDLAEDGKFNGSILFQDYLPDKSIENKVFVTEGLMRRDLLLNVQKKAARNVVTGGIEITIFGDKLSDTGIIDFVDSYERDASIGTRNYLATAHESALEILKGDYGPQGVSKYLSSLIRQNIELRDVPKTNLHIFLRDFYKKGKDPYLPEIKQISPEDVEISGLSIFKNDKEIYVLPKSKMFFFKLLSDKHSQGTFEVKNVKGEDVAIRSIRSTHKYKLTRQGHSHLDIYLKIIGDIREYTGKRLDQKAVDQIAKKLEEDVNKECLKLVKLFQKKNVDPLGIGNFHLKRIRGYDFSKWDEDYKNMTFKIHTKVKIVETGVVE